MLSVHKKLVMEKQKAFEEKFLNNFALKFTTSCVMLKLLIVIII